MLAGSAKKILATSSQKSVRSGEPPVPVSYREPLRPAVADVVEDALQGLGIELPAVELLGLMPEWSAMLH
ncbi:MAG: hypothetical protein ACRDPD_12435 [Streptosporangiaceae bacterium]